MIVCHPFPSEVGGRFIGTIGIIGTMGTIGGGGSGTKDGYHN